MDRHWDGAVEGTDPEELHDLRVNARRVQAALRLFKEALPKRSRRHAAALKRLISIMGETRELDVFLLSIREAMERESGDRRGLAMLAATVEEERNARHAALVRSLRTSDWRTSMRHFLKELS
jgi:CHAD domain-containing protein